MSQFKDQISGVRIQFLSCLIPTSTWIKYCRVDIRQVLAIAAILPCLITKFTKSNREKGVEEFNRKVDTNKQNSVSTSTTLQAAKQHQKSQGFTTNHKLKQIGPTTQRM